MRFALPLTVAALAALSTPALAQSYDGRTWGQPYYGAYSQPSPLSEAEPEAHVRLGAAGDGYTYGGGPVLNGGYGHGPRRGYGRANGYYGSRYAYSGYRYGGGYGYGFSRSHQYDPPRPGYRDVWGYNDDRPPSRWRTGSSRHFRDHHGRDCDCPDVYLYDR